MNAILGFAQLLQYDSVTPLNPMQKENVDTILKAGTHLLGLINEVLDLASVESGALSLSKERVDIRTTLDEVLNLVNPLAYSNSVKIKNTIIENLAICVDKTRFKQVLLNLVSNAIKYNKKNGECRLSAGPYESDQIYIQVEDTGIGIPENKMASLFKPFERLGAEEEIEGTGIGLSITRRLVELMGGKIKVKSTHGEGSSFIITFPKGKQEPSSSNEEKETTPDESGLAVKSNTDVQVLYIEDNPANLELVKQILSQHTQFQLLSAPQAQLGIALAKEHHPDLILMDINLPGMDGVTALGRLRESAVTKDIPVIAVSADAMESQISIAMDAGFESYITKPIQMDQFLKVIDSFIKKGTHEKSES